MGKREDKYQLSDFIEIHEGFFERVYNKEVITTNKQKTAAGDGQGNKRGCGRENQNKVLGMIESKLSKEGSKKRKT